MTVLLVALGAAVGAPARYLIDRSVQARHRTRAPWGTFTVNTLGCLLIGALAALPAGPHAVALLGTGFCGALTTYSTFCADTVRLAREGARGAAALNVLAGIGVGTAAACLGAALVGVFGG